MKLLEAVAVLTSLIISAGCVPFTARNTPEFTLTQGEWNSRSTEYFEFYFRPGSQSEKRIDTIIKGLFEHIRIGVFCRKPGIHGIHEIAELMSGLNAKTQETCDVEPAT